MHLTLLQVFTVAAWLLLSQLAATVPDLELEQLLGQAVLDALHFARITVKEAAALMRTDESNLRKSLRGEASHHLSLTRLIRLPLIFWTAFGPTVLYLVAKKHARELLEDVTTRRSA